MKGEDQQDRLERLMLERKVMDRVGYFIDPRWTDRRLEVVESGIHERTRVRYLRVRMGGSGGGHWYRADEIRVLHPDDA